MKTPAPILLCAQTFIPIMVA